MFKALLKVITQSKAMVDHIKRNRGFDWAMNEHRAYGVSPAKLRDDVVSIQFKNKSVLLSPFYQGVIQAAEVIEQEKAKADRQAVITEIGRTLTLIKGELA